MKKYIVESYENYREEERLSTNNARRIEFLTTIKIMDELFKGEKKILDCAAGTGAYAFYLAEQGHEVTATDITPRHVEIIKERIKQSTCNIKTMVLDAVNMDVFEDESFDVVLNMGPFYHLTEKNERQNCMKESVRVLKKGGLLVTSYIPRYYVFQYLAMQEEKYLDSALAKQIVDTGVLRHDDEKCFWTDTYYSSVEEMEEIYTNYELQIIDHFAQDGLTPQFFEKADKWNSEQFKVWCDYHYSVCREKTILGASNHVVIVGRK